MYFKLPIVNRCIIIVAFFSITSFTKAQNKEHRIKQALKEFTTTENPKDGIKNLRSIQDIVEQTNDSLQGHYYLNLGIAYGQLNQADSSF